MATGFTLKAEVRERTGKGAARALRRKGQIPAVIYGNKEAPIAIAVPHKQVSLALYGGGFTTHVWNIEVDGQTIQALARDYQREPVRDWLLHVDFLRITARSRVSVDVPVHVVGEDDCPALKHDGVLNLVAHTVSVEAPATRIPEAIEVSVAGCEIGDTVTSDAVTLPADVVFTDAEAFPIITISAPTVEIEEEAEEAEAAAEAEAPAEDGEASDES
ncbi:50S ribosomal protein L25/general stress protein Ctc [Acuticoccus mangrovi]|uniref:Large ribosomal subunit protein bL25 n=1 Tax=Acuticoccus mangrovi TaxID=2796142 RepID=A0A934MFE8_9HYPH|nr:50S ribosomal protein L25/general stress protein Ctc [Acuticoccus mangrovi]MBJ3775393.1 50S ribosomal protein L25/general stress protein Ctc [Acuticoccus mangrovi]